MRLPNKVLTYKESILSKFPVILSVVKTTDITPVFLYKKVKSQFEDIGEFLETMDCLYALGKIELEESRGIIHYVD